MRVFAITERRYRKTKYLFAISLQNRSYIHTHPAQVTDSRQIFDTIELLMLYRIPLCALPLRNKHAIFMKTFLTNNIETVTVCQEYFWFGVLRKIEKWIL